MTSMLMILVLRCGRLTMSSGVYKTSIPLDLSLNIPLTVWINTYRAISLFKMGPETIAYRHLDHVHCLLKITLFRISLPLSSLLSSWIWSRKLSFDIFWLSKDCPDAFHLAERTFQIWKLYLIELLSWSLATEQTDAERMMLSSYLQSSPSCTTLIEESKFYWVFYSFWCMDQMLSHVILLLRPPSIADKEQKNLYVHNSTKL